MQATTRPPPSTATFFLSPLTTILRTEVRGAGQPELGPHEVNGRSASGALLRQAVRLGVPAASSGCRRSLIRGQARVEKIVSTGRPKNSAIRTARCRLGLYSPRSK
jgi:hypothetical protein